MVSSDYIVAYIGLALVTLLILPFLL